VAGPTKNDQHRPGHIGRTFPSHWGGLGGLVQEHTLIVPRIKQNPFPELLRERDFVISRAILNKLNKSGKMLLKSSSLFSLEPT
jgi:hypothetical protein